MRFFLRLAILLHAVRRAPFSVLRAIFWRARGFKVRSRNIISALAGQSPQAYRFWIHTREQHLSSDNDSRLSPDSIIVLIIAEAGSTADDIAISLRSLARSGMEVGTFVYDPERQGKNTDRTKKPNIKILYGRADLLASIKGQSGSWLCPMMAGDQLGTNSLAIYSSEIPDTPCCLIYGDDDIISEDHGRSQPYFKSDWNEELYCHQDYLSFSCIFRIDENLISDEDANIDIVPLIRKLIYRTTVKSPCKPKHVARVLHHRRTRMLKPAIAPTVRGGIKSDPRVSIIIPTKNKCDLLQTCISGVETNTYKNYEVVIIDHESSEPATVEYLNSIRKIYQILDWSGDFNYSAINNYAVRATRGDLICFLNNDIEMLDSAWLDILVRQAIRTPVGAVGPKLLYPDGTIQHAGVVIGVGGAAGHAHRYCSNEEEGYFNRPHLPQYVTAVTGACMMLERKKFEAVGGFDEKNFAVAFNDVDLCLKLIRSGWKNVYEPRSMLIHHESKSRGSDRLKGNRSRFASELEALKRIWHTDSARDPYHNVNLSRLSEQFQIDIW